MTNKIVDVASELFEEFGEPSDISVPSIAYWLRSNIGDLNITINKKYIIDENTLEIVSEEAGETFGNIEKSIFKMLYSIHYYERMMRKSLNDATLDSVISISDEGSSVTKVNKNEMAKTYASLRKQINEELMELTKNYNLNEAKPLQVVGDDTIPGLYPGETNGGKIYNRSII